MTFELTVVPMITIAYGVERVRRQTHPLRHISSLQVSQCGPENISDLEPIHQRLVAVGPFGEWRLGDLMFQLFGK